LHSTVLLQINNFASSMCNYGVGIAFRINRKLIDQSTIKLFRLID